LQEDVGHRAGGGGEGHRDVAVIARFTHGAVHSIDEPQIVDIDREFRVVDPAEPLFDHFGFEFFVCHDIVILLRVDLGTGNAACVGAGTLVPVYLCQGWNDGTEVPAPMLLIIKS